MYQYDRDVEGLELIKLMLELTQHRKILWHQTDPNRWEANLQNQSFEVEFIYFARTDEEGSDRTMARLHAFGLVFDHCIGTPGMEMLCTMLSVADSEWGAWRARAKEKLEHGLEWLQQFVE